jgi:hypothetical protein
MQANDDRLNRRAFLGGIGLSVGGVAFGAAAWPSLLEAAPAACWVNAADYPDACRDWQLDDMCAAYPPYAFVTGAVPAHTRPVVAANLGADWHWVC